MQSPTHPHTDTHHNVDLAIVWSSAGAAQGRCRGVAEDAGARLRCKC